MTTNWISRGKNRARLGREGREKFVTIGLPKIVKLDWTIWTVWIDRYPQSTFMLSMATKQKRPVLARVRFLGSSRRQPYLSASAASAASVGLLLVVTLFVAITNWYADNDENGCPPKDPNSWLAPTFSFVSLPSAILSDRFVLFIIHAFLRLISKPNSCYPLCTYIINQPFQTFRSVTQVVCAAATPWRGSRGPCPPPYYNLVPPGGLWTSAKGEGIWSDADNAHRVENGTFSNMLYRWTISRNLRRKNIKPLAGCKNCGWPK